jgi:hypothetical protein
MIKSIFGVIIMLFVISGFEWQFGVDPEGYISAYNNNKSSFQKTVVDRKVQYTLSFIPDELRIIQQYRKGQIDQDEVEKRIKQNETALEFLLEIEIPENGFQEFLKYPADSIPYEGRVEYFAFGFGKDITVNFDKSTDQPITGYTFERNFGASPKGAISFYVNVPDKTKNVTIQFKDQVYGTQSQKIVFELNDIKALPQLKKVTKWKNTRK